MTCFLVGVRNTVGGIVCLYFYVVVAVSLAGHVVKKKRDFSAVGCSKCVVSVTQAKTRSLIVKICININELHQCVFVCKCMMATGDLAG